MTITIQLPPDLENELSAEAAKLGLPLPEYALRILLTRQVGKDLPKTGEELVDYWRKEGLIGTRPEIADSQEHARQLREQAEHRKRMQ